MAKMSIREWMAVLASPGYAMSTAPAATAAAGERISVRMLDLRATPRTEDMPSSPWCRPTLPMRSLSHSTQRKRLRLLCAGIIGYRALKRSNLKPGGRLGIFGFGNSAHVTIQVALHWGCTVYVSTRGESHRELARQMGAHWVGDPDESPPDLLDSAILFAPVGSLVPTALQALDRGGTLALAGIYMTEIPPLAYEQNLFYEKTVTSVTANTREDGRELLRLASEIPIQTHVESFPLVEVNLALQRLKHDQINGAAVVIPG